ncbi:hypothetical protein AYJ59_01880 [Thiomicrospira sp. S5]|nr:hypothetical protein AYJ59_01880 [Thiomicrospira sp. S5]
MTLVAAWRSKLRVGDVFDDVFDDESLSLWQPITSAEMANARADGRTHFADLNEEAIFMVFSKFFAQTMCR